MNRGMLVPPVLPFVSVVVELFAQLYAALKSLGRTGVFGSAA